MKVFNLCCAEGHAFEGWFRGDDDFNQQRDSRRIECPLCGSNAIDKKLSAPRLNLAVATQPSSSEQQQKLQQLQALWYKAAKEVIAKTEDVGDRFAEEARRIHYGEAPVRGIRGVASDEERQALAEEGVDVMAFPLPAHLKDPSH